MFSSHTIHPDNSFPPTLLPVSPKSLSSRTTPPFHLQKMTVILDKTRLVTQGKSPLIETGQGNPIRGRQAVFIWARRD